MGSNKKGNKKKTEKDFEKKKIKIGKFKPSHNQTKIDVKFKKINLPTPLSEESTEKQHQQFDCNSLRDATINEIFKNAATFYNDYSKKLVTLAASGASPCMMRDALLDLLCEMNSVDHHYNDQQDPENNQTSRSRGGSGGAFAPNLCAFLFQAAAHSSDKVRQALHTFLIANFLPFLAKLRSAAALATSNQTSSHHEAEQWALLWRREELLLGHLIKVCLSRRLEIRWIETGLSLLCAAASASHGSGIFVRQSAGVTEIQAFLPFFLIRLDAIREHLRTRFVTGLQDKHALLIMSSVVNLIGLLHFQQLPESQPILEFIRGEATANENAPLEILAALERSRKLAAASTTSTELAATQGHDSLLDIPFLSFWNSLELDELSRHPLHTSLRHEIDWILCTAHTTLKRIKKCGNGGGGDDQSKSSQMVWLTNHEPEQIGIIAEALRLVGFLVIPPDCVSESESTGQPITALLDRLLSIDQSSSSIGSSKKSDIRNLIGEFLRPLFEILPWPELSDWTETTDSAAKQPIGCNEIEMEENTNLPTSQSEAVASKRKLSKHEKKKAKKESELQRKMALIRAGFSLPDETPQTGAGNQARNRAGNSQEAVKITNSIQKVKQLNRIASEFVQKLRAHTRNLQQPSSLLDEAENEMNEDNDEDLNNHICCCITMLGEHDSELHEKLQKYPLKTENTHNS